MSESKDKIRIDKWLWRARFHKTRSLASKEVSAGHVRVNSDRVTKPAAQVAPGDVLTLSQAGAIRVIRILAVGTRRGPAPEAQALYEDLDPPESRKMQEDLPDNPGYRGKGRPTKRDRRKLDLKRASTLE